MLRASDTISGKEGRATMVMDGTVYDLFYIKSFEASMEKEKSEVPTIGRRGMQHKTGGWSGSGSMTVYYMTSVFRKMAATYAKTGRDIYFTITCVNEDAASTVGKQTTVLYNCNIDNTILAQLDVEEAAMEEDMDFTFDDFDILNQFGNPVV